MPTIIIFPITHKFVFLQFVRANIHHYYDSLPEHTIKLKLFFHSPQQLLKYYSEGIFPSNVDKEQGKKKTYFVRGILAKQPYIKKKRNHLFISNLNCHFNEQIGKSLSRSLNKFNISENVISLDYFRVALEAFQ